MRNIFSCIKCNQEFTTNNQKHLINCIGKKKFIKSNIINAECNFCNKICKNQNSLSQHQLYCKLNPNRKEKIPSFGTLGKTFKKRKNKSTKRITSEETKLKIKNSLKKYYNNANIKLLHSERMKQAVAKYPKSYTAANRGRTKKIEYNGIFFNGNWELDFYKWAIDNNLDIVRNEIGFDYMYEGNRKYYPDFYIKSLDLFIEVKGYETDKDKAKWKDFPHKLKVIRKQEILKIRQKSACVNSILC